MSKPFFAHPRKRGLAFRLISASALLPLIATLQPASAQQSTPVILDAMTTELQRAFSQLGKLAANNPDAQKQLPPYFLSYSVGDASFVSISAQYGAVTGSASSRVRVADVQVRVGSPALDNTHGDHRASAVNSAQLPIVDDREALARTLWMATNTGYGNALDNYLRVKTEAEVRAKEEDTSPDFSKQESRDPHRQGGTAGGG